MRRLLAGIAILTMLLVLAGSAQAAKQSVSTLNGFAAPGTPAELNKVIVLKQGDPKADHVLVLIPGTSAGAAYFAPLAKAITQELPDYQVWSIERRENLLEDHSVLDQALAGQVTVKQLFDYYLGWLADSSISPHFQPVSNESAAYAKEWGMNVAVQDIRKVVKAAAKGGRTVVLGGHSLGGSMTTAYATWDFNGKPGVDDLAGLVYIDGGSLGGTPPTAEEAQASLDQLNDPSQSPFLDLLGLGVPWAAGVFNAVGSTAVIKEPTAPSVFTDYPLTPASLKPPVPTTNRGSYGYALDSDTSPSNLALVQVHIGSLAASGDPRDWENGELGTVERTAQVFSGIPGMDGTAWYHPRRLSIDSGAIDNGVDNPAQAVFGDHATHGTDIDVPIYAFATSLGNTRVIDAAKQLAKQSHVPRKDVVTVNKASTYAHIDPIAATPSKNAFLKTVVKFLKNQVR
jgi:pimeloyl-ACP methyl ester carboxylesterase